MFSHQLTWQLSSSFLACHSYDCVAPYVDIILHSGWFWAKSAASGSVRWCCFRSCWTVLSHVMWRRPSCLLQSAIGEADRILLASALLSMRIICPNRVSRRDWIIAVNLGWFVSLRTSSFRTNWAPFDAKQHTQTPLIECINLACIHLRYSPSSLNHTGILVRYTCCTASTSLRWRAVTSKSDFLSSA